MIKQLTYSIVVPVFNSEYSIETFYCKLVSTLIKLEADYEILFVNDCSNDNSLSVLKRLASVDRNVRIIELQKNYGQNFATVCGYRLAKGGIVITIDDDEQYDTKDIIRLVEYLQDNKLTMVFGKPINRSAATNKYLPTAAKWVFDNIVLRSHRNKFYFSSFRAINKCLLLESNLYFIWKLKSSAIGHLEVNHCPRSYGKSNYYYFRLLRFFSAYIFYGTKKIAIVLGITSFLLCLLSFLLSAIETGIYMSILSLGFAATVFYNNIHITYIDGMPMIYNEL